MPEITQFVQSCPFCQRYNKQTVKDGHLPPKQVKHLSPWDKICVDMTGPWNIPINNSVICLSEVIPVSNVSSKLWQKHLKMVGSVDTLLPQDVFMIMEMDFLDQHSPSSYRRIKSNQCQSQSKIPKQMQS